jgi:hypothetical protein
LYSQDSVARNLLDSLVLIRYDTTENNSMIGIILSFSWFLDWHFWHMIWPASLYQAVPLHGMRREKGHIACNKMGGGWLWVQPLDRDCRMVLISNALPLKQAL